MGGSGEGRGPRPLGSPGTVLGTGMLFHTGGNALPKVRGVFKDPFSFGSGIKGRQFPQRKGHPSRLSRNLLGRAGSDADPGASPSQRSAGRCSSRLCRRGSRRHPGPPRPRGARMRGHVSARPPPPGRRSERVGSPYLTPERGRGGSSPTCPQGPSPHRVPLCLPPSRLSPARRAGGEGALPAARSLLPERAPPPGPGPECPGCGVWVAPARSAPTPVLNLIPPLAVGGGVDLAAAGERAAPPPRPAQAWKGGAWAGAGRPVVTPSPNPPHGRKRRRAHPRRNRRRTEPRAPRRAGGRGSETGQRGPGAASGFL